MKKKLTILLFGLLLAVGWTSDASAQKLPKAQERQKEMPTVQQVQKAEMRAGAPAQATANQQLGTLRANAPKRTQNYNLNATVTHPKSWYQDLDPVTWTGGSQNITEPFTTAKGMMALLKRIYTDQTIPGAKYNAPRDCDIPYQTIQHGWDIIGTNYLDNVVIRVSSNTLRIYGITIEDLDGNEIASYSADQLTFPSGWTRSSNNYSYYWYASSSSGATVNLPASWMENTSGGAKVTVNCFSSNYNYSETSKDTIFIGNQTYGYQASTIRYTNGSTYYLPNNIIPGTITPPDDNGYTVLLVKLIDGINMTDDDMAPEYTSTTQELEDYFTTYVKEIQLLTDGLRVGSGTSAGTVFAYTGDLNRFFFLSKGKMYYYTSTDARNVDRAPFYSMYEEFSANDVADETGFTDFFTQMKKGATYDIKHDCMGVNYRQHYFSMNGKQGTTENRVNSLVFYIPDYRGILNSDWREYDTEHLPTVGMYMIELFADIEPSATQTDYYTVTVNWEDNLDDLTHTEGIEQTYKLYEVYDKDGDGDLDTTMVYEGPLTEWSKDYPVGDPSAYDITYYVIGTPTAATNPETFYAKSTPDDVTVPGTKDFVGLQWWRYESDYVAKNTADPDNNEVNYYRNWLAPHALAVQGDAGINKGNVGTAGRTLTLYRGETPVIDLQLKMNGNKAYYRIKYRPNTQQIEPGYDENGEKTSTNN